MSRWTRAPGEYLVKYRRFTDGELLHVLTGRPEGGISDFDRSVYAALQTVKAAAIRWFVWAASFSALGILSHFKALRTVSGAGLEIAPEIFAHVALVGLSVTTAGLCFSYTKLTFLSAWFSSKLKVGTPSSKAEYLLTFPDAYWHFSYLPGAIGLPRFFIAKRGYWPQLIYLLLVIVALMGAAIGSIALWVMVMLDVLRGGVIASAVSIGTVIFSAALGLLGWCSPFYYDYPRRYGHMGLVNLLGRRQGERNAEAHRRIELVALHMGLVRD